MAGHSKFKNIMHRKGAQDKKRAKLFSRLIREISVAAKLGAPDPDSNPRLRTAINNALSSNMSKDSIERAIKKNNSTEVNSIEEIIYEGFGPGGVAILVESMTDNRNRSASEIRAAFSKFNGNLGISGCVKPYFHKIGLVTYSNSIDSFDNFFEFCLSIEVEDIKEIDKSYEIIVTSELFHASLEKLENKFGMPNFSSLEWRALNNVEVSKEDDAKNLFKLLEKLEDLDDVQNVSSNFNINDSLMEKVI
ncbi:MAG: putative transcriptional regulatory protein [Alphaproteobacteria bacterium MarineAlpha8_Bin1]|nr:MAG: putative transcriptional regulatory protein [Alphaproteobacteria bacterium MarineAlpha8_Bin1]|tara:strand:+ start:832 stop:1578 length:747 start_codon:yes stop_codon:yes gene_type:complete